MVGSRDSIAAPNIVLDTIIAEAFSDACDVLEKADNFEEAVHDLIKENFSGHQRIIFNGNGYSEAWVEEAEKRGLPNIRSMVEAIPELLSEKSVRVFEKFGVFTRSELESRAEIKYENYAKTINIEAKTMIDMATKQIIPAVIHYSTRLADSIVKIRQAGIEEVTVQKKILEQTSALLTRTQNALEELRKIEKQACAISEGKESAEFYHGKVIPAMEALREPVDELEMLVDKEMWPMPSYGDLIFEV